MKPNSLTGEVLFASGLRATIIGESPAGVFAEEAVVWVLPTGHPVGYEQACLVPTARKAKARFLRREREEKRK